MNEGYISVCLSMLVYVSMYICMWAGAYNIIYTNPTQAALCCSSQCSSCLSITEGLRRALRDAQDSSPQCPTSKRSLQPQLWFSVTWLEWQPWSKWQWTALSEEAGRWTEDFLSPEGLNLTPYPAYLFLHIRRHEAPSSGNWHFREQMPQKCIRERRRPLIAHQSTWVKLMSGEQGF